VITVVAILIVAGNTVALALYAQRLTKYRVDIPPGTPFWRGRSWAFQRNVYRRENYTSEGQAKLWVLTLLNVVGVLAGIAAVLSLWVRWSSAKL